MTYPQTPGWKGEVETGREAAIAFKEKAPTIRARVLEEIKKGPRTSEQIAEAIGEHWMIVRARASELHKQGLIEDSGQRGTGALGGKVVVWRRATEVRDD